MCIFGVSPLFYFPFSFFPLCSFFDFLVTRHWLNNDKWKGESFKYKEMNWREQIMKDFEEWDKKQGEVADALRAQKIVE